MRKVALVAAIALSLPGSAWARGAWYIDGGHPNDRPHWEEWDDRPAGPVDNPAYHFPIVIPRTEEELRNESKTKAIYTLAFLSPLIIAMVAGACWRKKRE